MNKANTFHDLAMNHVDVGDVAKRQGLLIQAGMNYKAAYRLELKAAQLTDGEPSRGVLYRSAAWLACNAGMYMEALQTAQIGLDGQPYPEIRDELMEVLMDAQQKRVQEIIDRIEERTEVSTVNWHEQIMEVHQLIQELKGMLYPPTKTPTLKWTARDVDTSAVDAAKLDWRKNRAKEWPHLQVVNIELTEDNNLRFEPADVPVIEVTEFPNDRTSHMHFVSQMIDAIFQHDRFLVVLKDDEPELKD